MKETDSFNSIVPKDSEPVVEKPSFRDLVFAKNCTNSHGTFKKGDRSRGAFSPALVDSYLKAGILVRRA